MHAWETGSDSCCDDYNLAAHVCCILATGNLCFLALLAKEESLGTTLPSLCVSHDSVSLRVHTCRLKSPTAENLKEEPPPVADDRPPISHPPSTPLPSSTTTASEKPFGVYVSTFPSSIPLTHYLFLLLSLPFLCLLLCLLSSPLLPLISSLTRCPSLLQRMRTSHISTTCPMTVWTG